MSDEHRYWDAYPTYHRSDDGRWVGELSPHPTPAHPTPAVDPIRAEGASRDEVREALNYQFLTRLYELPTADDQKEFLRLFAIGSARPRPSSTAPPPYAIG